MMCIMTHPGKSTISAFIICLNYLFLPNISLAESVSNNAFGDPDYIVKMGDEWTSRTVTHDSKIGEADLVVSLGQVTYPALGPVIQAFAKEKGITIVMQQGTCGVSARKLSAKVVDIGAYCCPPGRTDRLPGIEFHTIGIAPIALITNTANELTELSLSEARKIFSGDRVKWSDVVVDNKIQLPKKNIQPITRLHCKKRPGHWRHILNDEDQFSSRIEEVGVIPDMIKEVSEKESAIGFEAVYMLEVHKKHGDVKVLNIDGYNPSDLQHLLFAGYPFYRTFNLTTWAGDTGNNKLSKELVASIKKHIETEGYRYGIISSNNLRLAGWKFRGDELIGEPDGKKVFNEHQ